MSKRIISALIILVTLLSLSGCAKTVDSSSSEDKKYPNAMHTVDKDFTMTVNYMTLEECLNASTDIVYATYTGKTSEVTELAPFEEGIECGEKYLHFKLQEQLKGEPIDLEIKMTTVDWKIPVFKSYGVIARFTSDASQYKEGETYLLVLKKYEFENGDVCYSPMRGIIIPTDGSKPQIYDTTLIEWHSDGFEEGDNIEEYIKEFIRNNAE